LSFEDYDYVQDSKILKSKGNKSTSGT